MLPSTAIASNLDRFPILNAARADDDRTHWEVHLNINVAICKSWALHSERPFG